MANKKINRLVTQIRENLGFFLWLTFGIFLYVLFFQPFPLDHFDFNNRLLFVAGFVAIIFFFVVTIRSVFRAIAQTKYSQTDDELLFSYACGFFIFLLSTTALSFYLRYVGKVDISFYVIFKLALICMVSPVVLNIFDKYQDLRFQNTILLKEKENVLKEIARYENDYLTQMVEFNSEYGTDQLNLPVAEVILLRSADNYVEIIYGEGNSTKKKLIRNTLKTLEKQLRPFPNFVRCHRTSIVNTNEIEKLNRKFNSHQLQLRHFDEPVPVSRQYLLKIRESL
ncbi:LytTR family DNA-binding domain-containing protein [Sunxiuqinia indica]|uniref:LytTR family DNA-binding domain-containing protein n=1 Tax=Sunxiuqinia indica TaxID=2692584 RepID=UPI00135837C9|nr:LytTR family DNA-binding domain-containing protein [Sunxiuqinia indica]